MEKLKKFWNDFIAWCNKYIGVFAFLTVVLYVLPNPFAKINLPSAQLILNFLNYKPELPVYQILAGLAILCIYLFRIKRKYKITAITKNFLIGEWRNDWGPPSEGHEYFRIDNEMRYYLDNGSLFFLIEDFKYNGSKNQIQFNKTPARPNDDRGKILNTLTVQNNDLLVGIEIDYPIKYTRIKQKTQ